MNITLCHLDEPLGDAFELHFEGIEDVSILASDICSLEVDAIVSPANSFGFMDGGLDYALSERFGWHLQENLQAQIAKRPMGELLVGESLVLATDDPLVPWLICAPTMRVPMRLRQTVNPFLAMKAILSAVADHDGSPPIDSVAIPGLGTGVGAVPPDVAAGQMRKALDEFLRPGDAYPKDFASAQKKHFLLNPDEINIWDP